MTDFLILVLASWRIANLLTAEEGPFEIFPKLRSRLGVKYDKFSIAYGKSEIGKVFACIWCLSVWVGGAITILYSLYPKSTIKLIGYPFGLSAGIVVLHKHLTR